MLFLVATPIGNLGDITLRALETLRGVDVIAAEDTRHSQILLRHHGIEGKPLVSFHEHNEAQRTAEFVERMKSGASVAVITDAGLPGISDPGARLVRACQRNLQLLVEYASDINGILILEFGKKAPGSYRESFTSVFEMDFASALTGTDRAALLASVAWRNDLIHEYEPEESNETFYAKLKEFLVAYRDYAKVIHDRFPSVNSTL